MFDEDIILLFNTQRYYNVYYYKQSGQNARIQYDYHMANIQGATGLFD